MSPGRPRGAAGGAGGKAADETPTVIVYLNIVFYVVIVVIAIAHWKVWTVVLSAMGIAALYFWAKEQEELDTGTGILCIFAIVVMTVIAVTSPIVDCSACHLDKNTTSWKSIERDVKQCLVYKTKFQQIFPKKSDLFWKKTKSGGAEKIWPNCFDDAMAAWDPCNTRDYVDVELSCKHEN